MRCEVTIDDEPIVVGSKCAHVVHIGDNELGLISSEVYKELSHSNINASTDVESKELPEVEEGIRARTLTEVDRRSGGSGVFDKGTICIVGYINHDEDDPYPYRLDYGTDGDFFWYSRDMFEVIPDTEICVGDIVKTSSGSVAVVTHIDEQAGTSTLLFPTGDNIKYFTNNLHYTGKHCFHIDEVFGMLCEDFKSDDEEDV